MKFTEKNMKAEQIEIGVEPRLVLSND